MGTDEYTIRALYDVIRHNLLLKDRDLVHFVRTMNDNIIDDFKRIKISTNLSTYDITNRFENYTIVYMMIRSIMRDAKISSYHDKVREITDMFLNDELEDKSNEKPFKSDYYEED